MDEPIGWFSPSPFPSLAGLSCDKEIDEFSCSAFIYRARSQSHLTGQEGEWFCFIGPGVGIEDELHSPSWPFSEQQTDAPSKVDLLEFAPS